jgi:aminoglycoside phosphotransferase (APT) family kinase protein
VPQTLLHGDPHPGNTYGLADGTTGFYDWQLVRSGTWAHDVGYFVISALTVADRRAHERELLAGYLDALTRLGVPRPDRDDAWRLYRRTPVFGLASWLHTLSGGGFQPTETCLATIERFAAAYADHSPAAGSR